MPRAGELRDLLRVMPFAQKLGIELLAATSDEVRGRMPWSADLCTSDGVLHGGALMSLADSLGGLCAYLNLPAGTATATVESKTNFFRAVKEGYVEGLARPLHVGRNFIVVQTDLSDRSGRRIAQVTQTQAVLTPH